MILSKRRVNLKMYYIVVNKLNLVGKKKKKLEEVKNIFARAGKQFEVLITDHYRHATELASEITSNGEKNVIVAMGGDGTLHDILNGFKDFENNSLGVIPFGTGNDFAAAIGLTQDVKLAAEIIAFRAPQYVDYIDINDGELRSMNAIGTGIDVDVLKRYNSKKSHTKGSYLRSLIISLMKFKSQNFTVEYNNITENRFGLITALGNGRQFGGGIKMFPEADPTDGYLDLFVIDYISRIKIPAPFLKLMRGKANTIKNAIIVKCKEVKFSVDGVFTVQADGELYEYDKPLTAKVVPNRLKFYLP